MNTRFYEAILALVAGEKGSRDRCVVAMNILDKMHPSEMDAHPLFDDYLEKFLDLAITQTLRVAKEAGIKMMAMPAIGTRVFKFPPELAAER